MQVRWSHETQPHCPYEHHTWNQNEALIEQYSREHLYVTLAVDIADLQMGHAIGAVAPFEDEPDGMKDDLLNKPGIY
jgi:hypothetical protein